MIKIIVRVIVLAVLFATLLLASNKHKCVAVVCDSDAAWVDNKPAGKSAFVFRINFWWALVAVAIIDALLWIGGFFG